jgi:hypothetical protein
LRNEEEKKQGPPLTSLALSLLHGKSHCFFYESKNLTTKGRTEAGGREREREGGREAKGRKPLF